MLMYNPIITLNLGHDTTPTLSVPQFDTGRVLNLYIEDYIIPENSDVRVYMVKPSGHEIFNACTYVENLVATPGTIQMFAEIGKVNAWVQILTEGTILTAFPFYLDVVENPLAWNKVESCDEYMLLEDLISQAKGIFNAEKLRVEAENRRIEAEESRESVESSRVTAELIRIQNETVRETNEATRIDAEDKRTNNFSKLTTDMQNLKNDIIAQGNIAEAKGNNAQNAADNANNAASVALTAAENISSIIKSTTGSSITLTDSSDLSVQKIKLHGHAYQVSTTGAQLFNKSSVTSKSYVRDTDGTVVASTTRPTYASDYITLDGAESIYITSTMTSNRWGAFYNDKKEYVSGIAGYSSPITVPVGAVYIRLTVADDNLDTFMVNTGSTALPFEPYTGGAPSPSVEYPQAIDIAGLGWATGAQLWDMGDVSGTQSAKVDVSVPIPPGTYTLSADVISSDTDADTCLIYDYTNNIAIGNMARRQGKSKTFTTDKEIRSFVFYASVSNNGSAGDTFSFKNIMLNAGSSALPWEPYTGGKQEYYEKGIDVDVRGANLFDISKVQSVSMTSGSETINNNDGTLTVQTSQTGSSGGYEDGKNVLRDLCPELRAGDIAVLSAKSTGTNKYIYLQNSKSTWAFGRSRTISETDLDSIVSFYASGTSTSAIISDIMLNAGSIALPYEPYKTPQSVSLSTPNGLAGLKVSSGGNYTDASGQQWICDEIVRNERGTGKRIQRIGIIESYASETINTAYMSTTGQLTEGATVIYVLDDAIETDLTAEEIAALSALHTYSPTTTISNDAGCDMEITYATTQAGKYISQNLEYKRAVDFGALKIGNILMEYDYRKKAITISFLS